MATYSDKMKYILIRCTIALHYGDWLLYIKPYNHEYQNGGSMIDSHLNLMTLSNDWTIFFRCI